MFGSWVKSNGIKQHNKKRSLCLGTNSRVQTAAQHFLRISAQAGFARAPQGTLSVSSPTKFSSPHSGSAPGPQDGDKDEVTAAGAPHPHAGSSIFAFLQPRTSVSAHCPLQTHISKGSRLGNLGLRAPGELLEEFFGLLISIFNKS